MVRENDPRIEHTFSARRAFIAIENYTYYNHQIVYYLIKKVQIDVTALTNDIFKFLVTSFKKSPAIAKDILIMTSLLSTWKAFILF